MGGGGGKAGARARARMCSCQLVRWGLGRRICMRPSSWRRLGRDHGMHAELEVMEGDGGGGRRARERRAANQGRVSSESGGWGRVNVVCAHVWCACGPYLWMCACGKTKHLWPCACMHLASQCSGVSRAPFSVTVCSVFWHRLQLCVYGAETLSADLQDVLESVGALYDVCFTCPWHQRRMATSYACHKNFPLRRKGGERGGSIR